MPSAAPIRIPGLGQRRVQSLGSSHLVKQIHILELPRSLNNEQRMAHAQTHDGADLDLASHIRTIPDYPKPGIMFRDISTLMLDARAFGATIDRLAEQASGNAVQLVAGIEARGFIFASALAYKLGCGTLMLRKPGKLPGERTSIAYDLEYGQDRLEMHVDAYAPDTRIILVDDLIATGGTALAAVELLRGQGATVDLAMFVIDLPDLGGALKLQAQGVQTRSLVAFAGD